MPKIIIPQSAINAAHLEVLNFGLHEDDRFSTLEEAMKSLNPTEIYDTKPFRAELEAALQAAAPHIIEVNSNVDCYKLAEPFFLPRDHLEASEKGFTSDKYDYEYAQGYNEGLEKMAQLVESKIKELMENEDGSI